MLKLIHVTLASQLDGILVEGLIPQIGERSRACGESVPAVFCFQDKATCDDALMNWFGDIVPDDQPLVLLTLGLDETVRTEYDEVVGYEVKVLDHIPARCIIQVEDEQGNIVFPLQAK